METVTKEGQAVTTMLARRRAEYANRLKKVARARTRLDKQQRKLAKLEVELARLCRLAGDIPLPVAGRSSAGAVKASVIVNPKAKCLEDGTCRLDDIVAALQAVGIQAEVGIKTSGKVARRLARAAVARKDALLIVAGGDGTIEDVAPALIGSSTTLGILPLGTMNNLARSLGVPLDLHQACTLLALGTTRQIDLGRVKQTKQSSARYFLEMAGVGLSALAVPIGQDFEKGRWATLLGRLGSLISIQTTPLVIQLDGGEVLPIETHVATVSNAPLFGNNLPVAPDAKMDDGYLDLAVYERMDKVDLGRYFLALSSGNRVDDPRIRFYHVRSVRITAGEPLSANADVKELPQQPAWTFEVIPQAVTVIAGNGPGLALPVRAAS